MSFLGANSVPLWEEGPLLWERLPFFGCDKVSHSPAGALLPSDLRISPLAPRPRLLESPDSSPRLHRQETGS